MIAWCMDKRSKWRRRRNKAIMKFISGGDKYFYFKTEKELQEFWSLTPKEHYERYNF